MDANVSQMIAVSYRSARIVEAESDRGLNFEARRMVVFLLIGYSKDPDRKQTRVHGVTSNAKSAARWRI